MAGLLFLSLALLSAPHPFSLLFALVLHEGTHIISAALLGFNTPRFSLTGAGARLSYCSERGLFPSLFVSLSGCLFGLLASLIPFLPLHLRQYSIGLSVLNLLPISCLDGGVALLLILEAFMLPDRAYRISAAVSGGTVLFLWVLSTAVQLKAGANLSLLSVSLYLTVTTLTENTFQRKNGDKNAAKSRNRLP